MQIESTISKLSKHVRILVLSICRVVNGRIHNMNTNTSFNIKQSHITMVCPRLQRTLDERRLDIDPTLSRVIDI